MNNELQHYELPDGQLSLLPRDEIERLTEQELEQRQYKQGIYSGIDARRNKPELYALAVSWIAENKSDREVSLRTGFCRNLIRGIRLNQTQDIEHVKKEIAEQSFDAARMTIDAFRQRMIDLLGDPSQLRKISPERLTLAYCQLVDKGLVASGEVTQRVESVDGSSGADEFEAQFQALQLADVEELPAMGCEAGIPPAKGGGSVGSAGPDLAAAEQPGGDDNDV